MASFIGSKKGPKPKAPSSVGEQRQSKRLNPVAANKAGAGIVEEQESRGSNDNDGAALSPEKSAEGTKAVEAHSPPEQELLSPEHIDTRTDLSPDPDTDTDTSSEIDSSSSSGAEMPTEKNNITISDGVEIPKVNGLPCVTASTLTAQMLRDFEDYANVHFTSGVKKELTEKRKMKLIAGCFANKEVMNWIISEADKQDDTVTFSLFLDKLRNHFLDSNWEVQVQRQLLNEMMSKDDKYTDWATRVKRKNDVLKNTKFHLNESNLCDFLQHHLCNELTVAVYSMDCADGRKLHDVKTLAIWEKYVRVLDEKRLENRRMVREELDAVERQRAARSSKDKQASTSGNKNGNGSKNGKFTEKKKEPGDAPPEQRCPRLTDEEKAILSQFNGCYKCRQTLVKHGSNSCPNGWPTAEGYRPVKKPSKEAVDAFKTGEASTDNRDAKGKAPAKPAGYPNKKAKRDTAAAVEEESDEGDDVIAAMNEAGDTTLEVSDDD